MQSAMKEKILQFLTEIRPEFDFSQASNFIEEGLLDSFDIVTLVDSLDREYGVSIDGLDIIPENFSNVKAISELLIKNGISE